MTALLSNGFITRPVRRANPTTGVWQFGGAAVSSATGFARPGVRRDEPMPIIDTHQHLWDLSKFHLPWVKNGTALARSHLLSDYHAAAEGLEVVKTIYMEVDVEPSDQQAEAEFVQTTCRQPGTRMVAGVVAGRPADPAFKDYVGQFRGSPLVKGVRQVLHGPSTPAGFCLQPAFVAGARYLGDLGLRFD